MDRGLAYRVHALKAFGALFDISGVRTTEKCHKRVRHLEAREYTDEATAMPRMIRLADTIRCPARISHILSGLGTQANPMEGCDRFDRA